MGGWALRYSPQRNFASLKFLADPLDTCLPHSRISTKPALPALGPLTTSALFTTRTSFREWSRLRSPTDASIKVDLCRFAISTVFVRDLRVFLFLFLSKVIFTSLASAPQTLIPVAMSAGERGHFRIDLFVARVTHGFVQATLLRLAVATCTNYGR